MRTMILVTIIAAGLPMHSAAYSSQPWRIVSTINTPNKNRKYKGLRHLSITFSKNDDNDDGKEDEEWLDLSAPIDFSNLENKTLDRDAINMGWIRAREPIQKKRRIQRLTDDEIQRYNRRTKRLQKDNERERLWNRFLSWLSPVMTFLIPRKYSTTTYEYEHVKRPHISTNFLSGPDSGRNLLVLLNILAFAYQVITAVQYLPGFNRILTASVGEYGRSVAPWTRSEVLLRALGLVGTGSGVAISSSQGLAAHSMGPFFVDFAHQPYPLSHFQKHRFITSGFLHGSLFHLFMNMRALISLPNWLENGLGKGLYLSAYLVAIITGNIAHSISTLGELPGRASSILTIGASGGICGLYGLMFASLLKISNPRATSVFKQMLWLIAFGYLIPNVSNAAHIGGFLGGCVTGFMFGPAYFRSRVGRGSDQMDPEFRSVVGPGK